MKLKKKRIGDILINPIMGDVWFLNKSYDPEEEKEVWMLNLIHTDYQERLEYVEGFTRVGNIYDMLEEKFKNK